MKYFSTRDSMQKRFDSALAIKQGLANDGGLFIPESIPSLTEEEVKNLCRKTYPQRAADILSRYLTDYTYEELLQDCEAAYSEKSFHGGAAPVKKIDDSLFSLELWHGPTAAFKDMALQIMPRLFSKALYKTEENNTALILVATSGDTGKAALEGYKDIERVKIMVFYPADGVSQVQKLQMATQTGNNVMVYGIHGNFDDAQNGVKKIFADRTTKEALQKKSYILSSANSINWGRLVPQIVYYISAYCDLISSGDIVYGEEINVCVPTGNFGNIFAAYLARKMGIPIHKLICASNSNNVLTDFLRTGTYDRNRNFHTTMSPSMDILISSNLERLLSFMSDAETTSGYMKQLNATGSYAISDELKKSISDIFSGYYANEKETAEAIQKFYQDKHYLADPHTAVALSCAEKYKNETGDLRKIMVASTASPYKFAADVYRSITGNQPTSDIGALNDLATLTKTEITYPLRNLEQRKIRFSDVIDVKDMTDFIYRFL